MDIKSLAEIKDLHQTTLNAARAEKAATFHLLKCLHRVDVKRAFLELGYSSLFVYVHKGLLYSEAQACERIEAMRLAFRVKEVGASLKAGELTMTAVAKLSTHARRENLSEVAVVSLSKELAHKSVREAERVLAKMVTKDGGEVRAPERMISLSATQSRLQITIDEECEALLKEARELDANPGVAWAEVLKRALKMYVTEKRQRKYGEKKRGEKRCAENKLRAVQAVAAGGNVSPNAVASANAGAGANVSVDAGANANTGTNPDNSTENNSNAGASVNRRAYASKMFVILTH